jgi:hypothetical protein
VGLPKDFCQNCTGEKEPTGSVWCERRTSAGVATDAAARTTTTRSGPTSNTHTHTHHNHPRHDDDELWHGSYRQCCPGFLCTLLHGWNDALHTPWSAWRIGWHDYVHGWYVFSSLSVLLLLALVYTYSQNSFFSGKVSAFL